MKTSEPGEDLMGLSTDRTEAANDLLTVTVSFVLYMTMLLVLVAVQGQHENGPLELARGWTLQQILGVLLLILAAGHFIGWRVVRRQRRLRLLLTAAEAGSAASLFLLAPTGWVWLIPAAGAFAAWSFCFQVAVLEFMEEPEDWSGRTTTGATVTGAEEHGNLPETPEAASAGASSSREFEDAQPHV